MTNNNLNTDTYKNEANAYFNELAAELGHPDEQQKTARIWRAVIHSIRDRITLSEAFDLMAQMPVILRGIFSDQWKYSEKPPLDYEDIEGLKKQVKRLQSQYGEEDFNWEKSTEEIFSITVDSMKKYLTEGQLQHLRDQMPKEVKELVH